MLTRRTGQDLPQWIAGGREAGLPGISSFAKGLEQDIGAVMLGLTSWNSGPVEGRVLDDQTPDVRLRRIRPATQAGHSSPRVTRPRISQQSPESAPQPPQPGR
jgi:hypothetical protein